MKKKILFIFSLLLGLLMLNGGLNKIFNYLPPPDNMPVEIAKDFEEGLKNLKEVAESRESPYTEKDKLLDYYQETADNLYKSMAGLSEAQMQFKPNPNSWSISQCIEHIIATEAMLFDRIKDYMQQPENPEQRGEIKFTDEEIIAMVIDRSEKHQAPDILQKEGIYNNPETGWEDFRKQRESLTAFIHYTDTKELRNRVNQMPAGMIDSYQSMLFLAGHTARHTLQIEEVKESGSFPEN